MTNGRGSSERDDDTEMLLRSVSVAVKPFRAGKLSVAPLAHLFVYLDQNAWSGSLWLFDDRQDSMVQFVHGAPAKAKTTLQVPHLGELLMDLGLIGQKAYDETIPFALRGGGLHGAMLVACGMLDAKGLETGLREQTALRLIELFRNVGPSTRFAFYRDVDLLASWGGPELTPVDPFWTLWWGTHARGLDESVWSALELLEDDLIVLDPRAEFERFGFGPAERRFLAWWGEQGMSLGALLSYDGLPRDVVASLVFVLFLTRNLAYEEALPTQVRDAPSEARPEMDSVTDLFERPSPADMSEEGTVAGPKLSDPTLDTGRPSGMLTVEDQNRDMHISVVFDEGDGVYEKTERAAVALPPPPRPEEPEPSAMDEPEPPGSTRMTQAFQTLLDPLEQADAEEPPPPRGPTHSELDLAQSAEAMQLSSKSHEALRQGDVQEAERLAAAALELLPTNAVLKTDYAWAASLLPARRRIGDVGDLLDLLHEATDQDPALDSPYYVRGTIYQYLGLHAQAYAEFRSAFARNAHHAQAAAKIQEYVDRIQRTGSVDPDADPGKDEAGGISSRAGALLSKLWKRGK